MARYKKMTLPSSQMDPESRIIASDKQIIMLIHVGISTLSSRKQSHRPRRQNMGASWQRQGMGASCSSWWPHFVYIDSYFLFISSLSPKVSISQVMECWRDSMVLAICSVSHLLLDFPFVSQFSVHIQIGAVFPPSSIQLGKGCPV
jgi:hypothetical protein